MKKKVVIKNKKGAVLGKVTITGHPLFGCSLDPSKMPRSKEAYKAILQQETDDARMSGQMYGKKKAEEELQSSEAFKERELRRQYVMEVKELSICLTKMAYHLMMALNDKVPFNKEKGR